MTEFANESEFHRAFEKWMRANGFLFVTSRMDKAATIAAGDPDYLLIANGSVLPLELKMPKTGRLSSAQEARHAEYAAAGTKVYVMRDLDDATEIALSWRNTLTEIHVSEPGQKITWWHGKPFHEDKSGVLHPIKKSER